MLPTQQSGGNGNTTETYQPASRAPQYGAGYPQVTLMKVLEAGAREPVLRKRH